MLVNNLLFQALRQRNDLMFESREAVTKSGESFQAWKLLIKDAPSKGESEDKHS